MTQPFSNLIKLVAKLPGKCVVDSFALAKLTVCGFMCADKEHSDSSDGVVTDFNTYTESFGKHRLGEKVWEHPEHRCALRTTEKPPEFVWMKTAADWGQELASWQTNACIKFLYKRDSSIKNSPWCWRRLWSHVLTHITIPKIHREKEFHSTEAYCGNVLQCLKKKHKKKQKRNTTCLHTVVLCHLSVQKTRQSKSLKIRFRINITVSKS